MKSAFELNKKYLFYIIVFSFVSTNKKFLLDNKNLYSRKQTVEGYWQTSRKSHDKVIAV